MKYKKYAAYFVIGLSVVLLAINLYEMAGQNEWLSARLAGPISNVLLIVAMLVVLRENNKKQ